jgi:hypothetical protein
MAKRNVYDFIISELLYRASVNASAGPYLQVSSNLTFNDKAPFNFNGNVKFTSELKNIPTGYTVKANSHTISYPIVTPQTISSNTIVTSNDIPLIFNSINDLFTINCSITLEKPAVPDIIITKQFIVTASGSIFFGTKSVNNEFNQLNLLSTVSATQNQTILFPESTSKYIYIVFPTGFTLPLFLRDRNGLVIDLISNFTKTTISNYDYYVLNWVTDLPTNSYWEIIYNV